MGCKSKLQLGTMILSEVVCVCVCACVFVRAHARSVVSDSLWPHVACQGPCPWDFLGENTGVGCHFLLQGICLIHVSCTSCIGRWILYHYATREVESFILNFTINIILYQWYFCIYLEETEQRFLLVWRGELKGIMPWRHSINTKDESRKGRFKSLQIHSALLLNNLRKKKGIQRKIKSQKSSPFRMTPIFSMSLIF